MIIEIKSAKIGIKELKGIAQSLPEACIVNFKELVRKKIKTEEPDWQNLTPKARQYAQEIINACIEDNIVRLCQCLYG